MSAAALTINGQRWTFVVAQSENGFPLDQEAVDEEELQAGGIDGRRWRTKFLQHEPQTIVTYSDFPTHINAVSAARLYRKGKGQLVSFDLTAGGFNYSFQKVHISRVDPRPSPGIVTGGEALSGNTAFVRCVWTLEYTTYSDHSVL